MVDALGIISPFHLEFVRSAEAFKAVLKANFAKVPSGVRKIAASEFVLYESATCRTIDLTRDWSACFAPGQRIDMRMVFRRGYSKRSICPACKAVCTPPPTTYSDTTCKRCGLLFGRHVETVAIPDIPTESSDKFCISTHALALHPGLDMCETTLSMQPITAYDEVEHIQYYRRIRILSRSKRRKWLTELEADHVRSQLTPGYEEEPGCTRAVASAIEPVEPKNDMDGLAQVVDMATFEQLLEMEEADDVHHEFSKCISLDFISQCEHIRARLRPIVFSDNPDLHEINGSFHFWKGIAYGIGAHELGSTCANIQFATARGTHGYGSMFDKTLRTAEEAHAYVKQLFPVCEAQFALVKKGLCNFYRLTPEEVDDVEGVLA
jgi:hypothetical protein